MQDELNQFDINNIWDLVLKVSSNVVIGTIWIFHNKLNENGNVLRNKVRLVVKGYN